MEVNVKRVVWLAIVFMLSICTGAWALGKITVDPNAGVNRAQVEEWSADTRLAQKVTYEARHKAVKTILADLSEITGITFNAGYNKNDWQVRDRKMNIFAKDIVLADLMSSIARVMKFKWSVNKDGVPWTYRLCMDRKPLAAANAELSKAQKGYDEEVNRRRRNFLNQIENWSDDLSSEQMDAMQEEDPYTYRLHTNGTGAVLKGIFSEMPEVKNDFVEKRDASYSISSLSSETQELILKHMQMWYGHEGNVYGEKDKQVPEEYVKALSTGGITFDFEPDEFDWKKYEHNKFGGFGVYVKGRFFHCMPFIGDSSSPMLKYLYGRRLPPSDKRPNTRLEAEIEESELMDKLFPIEPQADVADEPDLHKKIKVTLENKYEIELVDYQAAIEKASGLSVVSDSYRRIEGGAAIGSEAELKDILSEIGKGYRYNWDKHGHVIELKSKEWFKRRTTQVPDDWVEQWRANLKKIGYVSIDDYSQIASLTTDQIEENIRYDDLLGKLELFSSAHTKDLWLLRLYGSLNQEQKKGICSERGLSLMSLSNDQWDLVCRFYPDKGQVTPTSVFVSCSTSTDNQGQPVYLFTLVDVEKNKILHKWFVPILKYEPPKIESQKSIDEKKSDSTSTSAEPAKK
jgi:hypothetical protein